jgi:hypothetical protein
MNERDLLVALLRTERSSDVSAHVQEFLQAHQTVIGWKPVGDRVNNSGNIQVAGDPARALIERVTNGIDAVVQHAFNQHSGKPVCRSPKEAASAWFGVPSSGIHQMTASARRQLALQSVTVTLFPGDGRSKRAVQIADKGVGLTPDAIPKTILSLNAENKLDKFYLIGAFGQGGSATFATSDFTLIASRDARAPDLVGFTIVKFSPPQGMKLGSYVYLVRSERILTCEPVEEMMDFSTMVRHYGYDLDDYPSPLGPSSLYGRAQSILFDPVLPFYFDNRVHDYKRTIKGSRSALNGAKEDEEGEDDSKITYSCPIFFSDLGEFGRIGIEYWVLEPSAKSAPNKAFVSGTKPIVLTVNGQTHAEWTAALLRKDAGLTHLTPRMVVHVSCDSLSDDAKRVLFVSNREESRRGMVQNLIREELLEAFRNDDHLQDLQQKAKEAGTKARDEETEKEVRREVARMLKSFGFSVTEEVGSAKTKEDGSSSTTSGGEGKPRPKLEPIPVSEPPTFVEIRANDPVAFYPGQRKYVRVRTNAHSRYHDARDPERSKFGFIVEGPSLQVAGSSELREGHLRVILAAKEDATVGDTGKFTVELHRTGLPTISTSTTYAIEKEPAARSAAKPINLPNIDCRPVEAMESEEWVSLGWPNDVKEIAADYAYLKETDTIQIRYSTLFPRYVSTLQGFEHRDTAQAQSFRKRFEIWLIMNVLIHWQDTQADESSIAHADLEQDQIDNYRRDELRRLVKASIVYTQREVLRLDTVPEVEGE